MYIETLKVVCAKNYKDEEIEIYNMYYLSGLSIQTIAKRLKMKKSDVIYILSDFSYRELIDIYTEHNRIKFSNKHKEEINK